LYQAQIIVGFVETCTGLGHNLKFNIKENKMKKIFFLIGMCFSMMTFAETTKVCVDVKDKEGKVVVDKKEIQNKIAKK
jgi:hypothetical protein